MSYISKALACILLVLPMAACQAEKADQYEAGVHYEVLPQPVPTGDANRVEVVELFWYGCHHCYDFEPLVRQWVEKQPVHVNFTPMPAVWSLLKNKKDWSRSSVLHAQMYYTLKVLKEESVLRDKIFEVMNLDGKDLVSEQEIADFLEKQGIDREKFLNTFNSFGVKQSVKIAHARQLAYGEIGTPQLIINGKYRIPAYKNILEIADFLIEKEWQEMQ